MAASTIRSPSANKTGICERKAPRLQAGATPAQGAQGQRDRLGPLILGIDPACSGFVSVGFT